MDGRTTKPEEPKNVVVLIDYENIVHEATDAGMVVDFEKLAELGRSRGRVVVSMVFVPKHQLEQDPWFDVAWLQGIYPVAVPSQSPIREKQYRTADAMMNGFGMKMCVVVGIDIIVIVSHDGDFTPLANHARDFGKEVIVIAGERISRALSQAVDLHIPLPMKN